MSTEDVWVSGPKNIRSRTMFNLRGEVTGYSFGSETDGFLKSTPVNSSQSNISW